jgi:hypothetical protein
MPELGINNWDSSFFSVKVENVVAGTPAAKYLTDKVISFEITEEMGKMMHGTLQMEENFDFDTSSTLKRFAKIEVQWGYKNRNQIQKDAYVKAKNPGELFTSGQLVRFAKGRVQNPSWSSGSDGKMVYNCSFMCFDDSWLGAGSKMFNKALKGTVVLQTLLDMGILTSAPFVKFRRDKEVVDGDTGIRRDNVSMFRFLHRLALEWQCLFRIAYDGKLKEAVALFCDYNDDKTIEMFVNRVGSSFGTSILWDYKDGKRNVMSYTAQYNASESGVGDSVTPIFGAGGTVTFQRTIAETQKVTYWVLQPGAMKRDMDAAGSIAAKTQLMQTWVGPQKFEDLVSKGYFVDVTSTTAPQGIGLTVNIEAIGDPLCTSPCRAKFGKGFPKIFSGGTTGTSFYQTGVTHKIDKSGYKMSVMCADAFTVSGGLGVG